MGYELVDPILGKLATMEQRNLAAKVESGLKKDSLAEHRASEAGMLSERALHLGQLMYKVYEKQGKPVRGLLRRRNEDRLVTWHLSSKSYSDPFASNRMRMTHYEGLITPVFGIMDSIESDGYSFNIGWQISTVHAVIHRAGRAKHNWREEPMSIHRVASEKSIGTTQRDLYYKVQPETGGVTSYTAGERDDLLLTIGKEAGAHAMHLMQTAIDFIAR